MPHVAELCRLTVALLVEPRLGIGRALVRLVAALLLAEAALGVPARSLMVIVVAVLPAEALDRHPRLDQRSVHREVIARQQPLHLRLSQNRRQELRRNLSFQKPIPVLGKARMVPYRIVHTEPDEPA